MSLLSRPTKSIIIGGLFFIIPLLLLVVLVKHAFAILKPIVRKIVDTFEIHSVFGAATLTVFTILILVFLCYLSGLLLKKGLISDWGEKMDDTLFLLFPSLQMLKYKIAGESSNEVKGSHWKPILLNEDPHYTIAFITKEHENGFLSIYIPDAPKMDAGEIRLVHKSKCEHKAISMKAAMQAISSFGKQGELSKVLED